MYAVMENKTGFTSLDSGTPITLLNISLKLRDGKICVDEVYRTSGSRPPGEIKLDDDVPASIIGHWIEVTSKNGEVIYRRYVQKSLPFNMENIDSRLQRIYSLEKYHIQVPDLAEGATLTLFEQSLPAPGNKTPVRKTRLTLGLMGGQTRTGDN